ncbi:SGNH hydrolase domain-containing protein [Marinobacter sp. GN3S48]|uniref:SGNH hydrolase domain-containing protein n=1 Tax=Marinobacter sp. GN3S48 TaxID=3382302 RepID=UPI00387B1A58
MTATSFRPDIQGLRAIHVGYLLLRNKQVLRSRHTIKGQALRWGVLVAAILGTSQCMAKISVAFTPDQLPIEYRRYVDPKTICHGKIVGDCLRGDLGSDKEVLVLGDSHAAMLNHFFDYLGQELNLKARIITAISCVTIPGFDYKRIAEWAQQPCLDQIERAHPYIEKAQTIFIAGVWNSQTRARPFNLALEEFFNSYRDKRIVILSQVPRFNRDVSRIQRFEKLCLPSHIERDRSYQVANRELAELAKSHTNVEFKALDSLNVFDQAPSHQGNLIYIDEHHINEVGARRYVKAAVNSFSIASEDGK